MNGKPRGHLGGRDAAARGGDEHPARMTARRERRRQGGQVPADQRPEIRVEHRRAEALVLPPLGQHLLRGAHEPSRQLLPRERGRGVLMGRIGIAVQEADDGGARSSTGGGRSDVGRRLGHTRHVERTQHGPIERHPLVHLQDPLARDERRGLERPDVVEHRPIRARDVEGVAEPPGRDDPDVGALALEDGVGPDGGPVNEPLRWRAAPPRACRTRAGARASGRRGPSATFRPGASPWPRRRPRRR